VTGEVLAALPVLDLTVEDPPIEDVIADIFQETRPPTSAVKPPKEEPSGGEDNEWQ
jgi:hypothetical protein